MPPAPSYEDPDPECDLAVVGRTAVETTIRYLLKSSFGFGGQNGALVLKRWQGAHAGEGR